MLTSTARTRSRHWEDNRLILGVLYPKAKIPDRMSSPADDILAGNVAISSAVAPFTTSCRLHTARSLRSSCATTEASTYTNHDIHVPLLSSSRRVEHSSMLHDLSAGARCNVWDLHVCSLAVGVSLVMQTLQVRTSRLHVRHHSRSQEADLVIGWAQER